MNIIVAGGGKVGSALVKQLSSENNDIVLIDSDPRVLESTIELYDIMAITGNCATMDVLKEAGVMDADLLIAATSTDEINLLSCLTAHAMNPRLETIARIRNPEYSDQTHEMKDTFGLSFMVNPDYQAASEIERLLKYPGSLNREYLSNGRFEIIEIRVDEKNLLNNVQLKDLNNVIGCSVLVCMVIREDRSFAPAGDFVIRAGDRVFVTAPIQSITLLLKNLKIVNKKVKKVVVCGGNRISYYLARRLQKTGISVSIIEKNYNRCLELAGLLPETNIIHGDATSQTLLQSEKIGQYDALITMTGMDELNMIISLYGTGNHVSQVITSIGHMYNTNIVNALNLGSVISPKELCSAQIVSYVRAIKNRDGAALSIHPFADGQAEAMEFLVDENTLNCAVPLKDIRLRKGILLAGIRHSSAKNGIITEIPNGKSSFQVGDIVIIVTSENHVIYQLNEIFEA